jgi:hypothetical protein
MAREKRKRRLACDRNSLLIKDGSILNAAGATASKQAEASKRCTLLSLLLLPGVQREFRSRQADIASIHHCETLAGWISADEATFLHQPNR